MTDHGNDKREVFWPADFERLQQQIDALKVQVRRLERRLNEVCPDDGAPAPERPPGTVAREYMHREYGAYVVRDAKGNFNTHIGFRDEVDGRIVHAMRLTGEPLPDDDDDGA